MKFKNDSFPHTFFFRSSDFRSFCHPKTAFFISPNDGIVNGVNEWKRPKIKTELWTVARWRHTMGHSEYETNQKALTKTFLFKILKVSCHFRLLRHAFSTLHWSIYVGFPLTFIYQRKWRKKFHSQIGCGNKASGSKFTKRQNF